MVKKEAKVELVRYLDSLGKAILHGDSTSRKQGYWYRELSIDFNLAFIKNDVNKINELVKNVEDNINSLEHDEGIKEHVLGLMYKTLDKDPGDSVAKIMIFSCEVVQDIVEE